MNKSFKFRLLPNVEQRALLAKTFGCVRFIYNRMLEDKKAYYELTGEMLYCYPSQYKQDFPWLCEVDSLALVGALNNLDASYANFFRGHKLCKTIGFPKFKSKHNHNSYTTNFIRGRRVGKGNIELADGYLKLPKLGHVRIKQHRPIPQGYCLKSVTVSRNARVSIPLLFFMSMTSTYGLWNQRLLLDWTTQCENCMLTQKVISQRFHGSTVNLKNS